MPSELEKLYQSLHKLMGLYRQLLDVIREERTSLENVDVNQIQTLMGAKEVLIQQLMLAEAERIQSAALISDKVGVPAKELSLEKVIELYQVKDPAAASKLRSAQSALRLLVKRVVEQNKENGKFVERSLEHVAAMKRNVLGEVAGKSDVYSQKGTKVEPSSGARLLSQEA